MAKKTEKKSEVVAVRMTKTLKDKLEKIAEKEDRSLAWVVNNILERHVTNSDKKKLSS